MHFFLFMKCEKQKMSVRNARSQEEDINLERLPDTLFSEPPGDEALQNFGRLLVLENAVYVMQRHCSLFDLVSRVARPVPQPKTGLPRQHLWSYRRRFKQRTCKQKVLFAVDEPHRL